MFGEGLGYFLFGFQMFQYYFVQVRGDWQCYVGVGVYWYGLLDWGEVQWWLVFYFVQCQVVVLVLFVFFEVYFGEVWDEVLVVYGQDVGIEGDVLVQFVVVWQVEVFGEQFVVVEQCFQVFVGWSVQWVVVVFVIIVEEYLWV